jgi:hypothetical protein
VEAAVGGGVHGQRRDAGAGATGQAAQDEHAGAIEVAGVYDRDAGAGDAAQELDHRPAGLTTGTDDQLARRAAAGGQSVDAIEKRLVLDDQRAHDRRRLEPGVAEWAR